MSKIPPPAKAKALPQSSAASSEVHSSLLTMAWTKLDALVSSRFDVVAASRPEAIAVAKETYRSKVTALADTASRFRPKGGGRTEDAPEVLLASLHRLEQRLRAQVDYEPKPLDESCFASSIHSRELELPLYMTKGSGASSRSELVGFVDIACEVSIPDALSLLGDPLICTGSEDIPLKDFFTDLWVLSGAFTSAEVDRTKIPTPAWLMSRKICDLWIDVRTTDTPIGQLIREAKALRDFADDVDAMLLVVVETMDETKRAMLKHEDILVATRQELESL